VARSQKLVAVCEFFDPSGTVGTRRFQSLAPFEREVTSERIRKDEILPGEQPPIMDRALFDAVQQKLTDQWTTQSPTRNASDHLLTGLLFDDVGHRMVSVQA
jgi:hypothetical protein